MSSSLLFFAFAFLLQNAPFEQALTEQVITYGIFYVSGAGLTRCLFHHEKRLSLKKQLLVSYLCYPLAELEKWSCISRC